MCPVPYPITTPLWVYQSESWLGGSVGPKAGFTGLENTGILTRNSDQHGN